MTNTPNPTAASLLGLLTAGELSGYDLHQVAQQVFGDFWTITRSQVYRELSTMADHGLVEPGAAGPRARRPYSLTPQGRAAFAEWIAQAPAAEVIRFPLLMSMTFGAWVGRTQLLDWAEAGRDVRQQRLAQYREVARTAAEQDQPFVGATVAFGIYYESAVLAWMDELPQLLANAPASPDEAAAARLAGLLNAAAGQQDRARASTRES